MEFDASELLNGLYASRWDGPTALRLMAEADAQVEALRAPGSHPEIQAAAARVADAHCRKDFAGVRQGCEAVVNAARRFAPKV